MAHINKKIDYTVSAYIVYLDKLLLRKHDKYGLWLPPGGHIETDEGLIEALYREVEEETGLQVEIIGDQIKQFEDNSQDIPLPILINRHFTDRDHEHIDFLYLVRAENDQINPTKGEMSDANSFKWFDQEGINDNEQIMDRIKTHAIRALQLAANHNAK